MSDKTKNIHNVFVRMESQEQCDRMKQLCIDNNLPIWNDFDFKPMSKQREYIYFYFYDGDFCNYLSNSENYSEVTEQEFIELLKSKQ